MNGSTHERENIPHTNRLQPRNLPDFFFTFEKQYPTYTPSDCYQSQPN